ncbi:MAG: transaldolase family protein [Candidatus Thermoplasmatota archaeon]|nr:transaldolase family protein [Candidatus Thermoplasmatota archaeon]
MQIFIDTADLDEIREAYSWGIVDGVTTNPSLIKKAVDRRPGLSMRDYIRDICRSVDGPVSLEVKGVSTEQMVQEAEMLYERFNPVNGNVVVKVPVCTAMEDGQPLFEGIRAIKTLEGRGIPTNATLVMTAEQALMAAKAGATYASPFLGRVDDYLRTKLDIAFDKSDYYDPLCARHLEEQTWEEEASGAELYDRLMRSDISDNGIYSGVDLVDSIVTIYDAYGFDTQVIAASVRNARQAREVAEMGVDIATLPFHVIEDMLTHPKTLEGMQLFTRDVVPEYEELFE